MSFLSMVEVTPLAAATATQAAAYAARCRRRALWDRKAAQRLALPVSTPVPTPVEAIEGVAAVRPAVNLLSEPGWSFILALVSMKHGVSRSAMVGPSKQRVLCAARGEAMYLLRANVGMNDTQIGRRFARDRKSIRESIGRHLKVTAP